MIGEVTVLRKAVMILAFVRSVGALLLLWRVLHGVMVENSGSPVRLAGFKNFGVPLTSCVTRASYLRSQSQFSPSV